MRACLLAWLVVGACAPVAHVTTAGPRPACSAGGIPDEVILVDIPETVTTPATQMWLCYSPDERSATPEMARGGLYAWMAEGHIWRGDVAGALQLFEHAYNHMPDKKRRVAIAFELAKRHQSAAEAAKWLWRAIDYVDSSDAAGVEYQELAEKIRMRLQVQARRLP
jgi:hypothetical protein